MIAATVWLCATAWAMADDLAVNNNPYTPIVTRNVFGLLPIPVNAPVDPTPVVPPPKITLNGITTILGSKEALYKIATPAKPGQPAHDQSYMLGEGESQDDIQVVKIDTEAAAVTFNNHGTIQQLPLTAAGNISSGASVSSPASGGGAAGLPLPASRFRRPGGPGFGGHTPGGNANPSQNPDPNAGAPIAAGPSDPQIYNPAASQANQLSPEAQALLIENNYNHTKNDPNSKIPPSVLPPTPLRGQSDGADPNQ